MLDSITNNIPVSIKEFFSDNTNLLIIVVVAILLVIGAVLFLTNKTNKIEGGEKYEAMFVLYYVDWCPHCKVVKPEWEKLENDTSIKNVAITKINCEKDEKAAEENNIEGFPTILFTHNNKVEAYEGGREYDDFKKFLMSKNL
jgi:thiol-disulfide isomerase/thioredoxin